MLDQNVKTVAKWLINFGEDIDKAFANGWQTLQDLPKFIGDFFSAPGMVTAAPAALTVLKAGLSDEDRAAFVAFVKSELNIEHEAAEAKAEGIVEWILATDKFVRLFLKSK